jgi:predicted TIM-barrel fold metal-dependent hydrolase
MLKKTLVILGILGILLIIGGLLFNPSLLAKFTSAGYFRSGWTVAEIHLVQSYLLIFGIVLLIGSLIISRLPQERRGVQYTLLIFAIGLVITIAGIVFSPSFIENRFSPIHFLEENNITTLKHLQLATIIFGCVVILVSLLFYVSNSNRKKKYVWIISISVLIFFLIVFDRTFLRLQYPSNIITSPGQYGKVVELLLGKDILLSDFDPHSTLILDRKLIRKAKYPVIDMNFHLNSAFQTDYDKKILAPDNLVKLMDSVGVKIIVNTDGVPDKLKIYAEKYSDRFINFAPTWFPAGIMSNDQLAYLPKELENRVKMGVRGDGEIWKYLGLKTRDSSGKVIPVDDPRLDPLWDKASELGIPILWHMGDPAAFFQPVNRFNERYESLRQSPDWSFFGAQFPSRETIMKQRENVLRKHPNTIFIGCHMGFNPDNLKYAAHLLDTYPNYYVEMSTVLSDLGRQPYTARKFFIKYQDRILFGTDGGNDFGEKGWTFEKYYRTYFEFLETENEDFSYPLQGVVNQGNWKICGIDLPDSVLEKVYYKNAANILKVNINK